MRTYRIAVLACGLVMATHSVAQPAAAPSPTGRKEPDERYDPQKKSTQTVKPLSEAEIELLTKLHDTNEVEIEVGKLAGTQGANPGVRSFGEMLVRDHTAADEKVMGLARDRDAAMRAPSPQGQAQREQESQKHKAEVEALRAMRGAEFDRQFASMMVKGHEKAIAMVNQGMSQTSDAQLSALLKELLPKLEKHLQTAQQLQTKVSKAE
jgi:putative membrane protein